MELVVDSSAQPVEERLVLLLPLIGLYPCLVGDREAGPDVGVLLAFRQIGANVLRKER